MSIFLTHLGFAQIIVLLFPMSTKRGTILVIDDNRSILTALELLLNRYFAKVIPLPSPNRLAATLENEAVDVVLLDMNFSAGVNSGNEGFFWLREIKKRDPNIQIVLFTAYGEYDLAVRAIKEGATDFVVKPWDNLKLIHTLRTAYQLRTSGKKEIPDLQKETDWPEIPETPPPASESFSTLEEMERSMIKNAVERCGGNLTSVAAQLGITRQTLYNKIKKYGL